MQNKFSGKKGVSPVMMIMFAILVGVVVLIVMNFRGEADTPRTLAVVDQQQGGSLQTGQAIQPVSLVEDVTVTFSSFDAYSKGTNAGTGHRILTAGDGDIGGDINLQVNDDATRTYSPGQSFNVLLGNLTDSLSTSGYYPTYRVGTFPDKGTYTVTGGQYAVAGSGDITFTFFNDAETANTDQALGTNSIKTTKVRVTASDNQCLGNPDTGGQNKFTYHYNDTALLSVKQLNEDGSDAVSVPTPTGAGRNITVNRQGYQKISYLFPLVCDNQQVDRKVKVESGSTEPETVHDVNITVSDISWYFNDDTFLVTADYVDEDNNDIGAADYVIGNILLS